MELTILLPVYNEDKTIIEILTQIKNLNLKINYEVIVINDNSIDETKKLLELNTHLYSKLINNIENSGKGFCVKKGLEISQGKYVIFQDADLEYDPKEFYKFINLINKFDPDLIIGSRINYDEYSRSHNFYNKLGNMLITTLFNMRYNTTFTDIYSCYICFKRDIIDPDKLTSNGFQQQAELLRKIIKKSRNHYEIKISYNGRSIEDGKKIRWHHIFSVIFEIFKFW